MAEVGKALKEVFYFINWGLFYGASLGLLAGTLIFPLWGSVLSTLYAIPLGLVLGFITGIVAATAQGLIDIEVEEDFILHRRRLSWWIGVFTAMAAPFLIVATSDRLLYISPVILPSVVLHSALWGGLAAAHTTSRYIDHFTEGVKKYVLPKNLVKTDRLLWQFRSHILFGIVTGAFGFLVDNAETVTMSSLQAIHTFIMFFIIGVSMSLIVGILIAIANGTLIRFLNRLVFYEYFTHLSKKTYQRVIVAIIVIFNLLICAPVSIQFSLWYFAPFIILASATSTARYADQHWGAQKKQQPPMPTDEWADYPFEDEYTASIRKAQ